MDEILSAYIVSIDGALHSVERIKQYLDNNGEVDRESVNWGSVSTINWIEDTLSSIVNLIGDKEE